METKIYRSSEQGMTERTRVKFICLEEVRQGCAGYFRAPSTIILVMTVAL